MSSQTVLVLGAGGRLGSAVADAFVRAGWRVRAQARRPLAWPETVEPILCDALDRPSLLRAADGAGVIVHTLNPSQYTPSAWRRQARQMLENAVAAAHGSGALLMLPGNVYNFGTRMQEVLPETPPEQSDTPFGAIRCEMETALARADGLDSVVLRSGEFFGGGTGLWFDKVIVRALYKGVVRYPGPLDRAHAWMYVPDLAETFVRVATRRAELRGFRRFNVPGHALTGAELVAALSRAVGRPLAGRRLPWPVFALLLPFSPMLRSLWMMRYLWQRPHRLEGRALAKLVDIPRTNLDDALAQALRRLDASPNLSPAGAGNQ